VSLFSVGQIIRPKRLWVLRDGRAVDFQARVSAQAWVAAYNGIPGGAFLGGLVWIPGTSAEQETDGTGEESYTIKVWDIDAQAVVTLDYSGDACDLGSIGGVSLSSIYAAPNVNTDAGRRTLNLIMARD